METIKEQQEINLLYFRALQQQDHCSQELAWVQTTRHRNRYLARISKALPLHYLVESEAHFPRPCQHRIDQQLLLYLGTRLHHFFQAEGYQPHLEVYSSRGPKQTPNHYLHLPVECNKVHYFHKAVPLQVYSQVHKASFLPIILYKAHLLYSARVLQGYFPIRHRLLILLLISQV